MLFDDYYAIVTARAMEACETNVPLTDLKGLETPHDSFPDGSMVLGNDSWQCLLRSIREKNLTSVVQCAHLRSLTLFGNSDFYYFVLPGSYAGILSPGVAWHYSPGTPPQAPRHSHEADHPVLTVFQFGQPLSSGLQDAFAGYIRYWQDNCRSSALARCSVVDDALYVDSDLAWLYLACDGNCQWHLNWLAVVAMEFGIRQVPVIRVAHNPSHGTNGYGTLVANARTHARRVTLR